VTDQRSFLAARAFLAEALTPAPAG